MTVLSDEAISDRFAERTATYDRENRFFDEDFEELKSSGYLLMAVPTELGGLGYTLSQVCQEMRRVCHRSPPATALATNMHVYWTGVAADLWRQGDKSCQWILEEAVAGEIFAAGHGEAGNDFPLMLSTTRAEKVEGGYKFYGHKIFGSLTPVWTRLGIHGMDTSDPDNPMIVHGFLPRDSEGYTIKETWDVARHAGNPQRRHDHRRRLRARRNIAACRTRRFGRCRRLRARRLRWAEPTFANVYLGIARRAVELAVAGLEEDVDRPRRQGDGATTRCCSTPSPRCSSSSKAHTAHVERMADDWSNGVDHGMAVADEARRDEVPEQSKRAREDRRPRDRPLGWLRHVQGKRVGAACTATCGAAASTPPTRRSCTRSSASRPSASSTPSPGSVEC